MGFAVVAGTAEVVLVLLFYVCDMLFHLWGVVLYLGGAELLVDGLYFEAFEVLGVFGPDGHLCFVHLPGTEYFGG